MDENKIEEIRNKYGMPMHYYGDIVRKLFVIGAVIMLGTLPFLNDFLPVSTLFSVLVVVVLGISAGLLAPRNRWVMYFDVAVSVVAIAIFEYYAVDAYSKYAFSNILFLVNQALAIIFLFALYNSAKTLRSL